MVMDFGFGGAGGFDTGGVRDAFAGTAPVRAPGTGYYVQQAAIDNTSIDQARYEFLTTKTTGPLGADAQRFVNDYGAALRARSNA